MANLAIGIIQGRRNCVRPATLPALEDTKKQWRIVIKAFLATILTLLLFVSMSSAGSVGDLLNAGTKGGPSRTLNQDRGKDRYPSQQRYIPQEQMIEQRRGEQIYNGAEQLFNEGRYSEAISEYGQALPITRKYNNKFGEMSCLKMIGVAYQRLGDHRKAIGYFQEAVKVTREMNDKKGEGYALYFLMESYKKTGGYANAIEVAKQRLEVDRSIGNIDGEKLDLMTLTELHVDTGDTKSAMDYSEQLVATEKRIGDKEGESIALGRLGTLHLQYGSALGGAHYLELGLQIAEELGNKKLKLEYLTNLGTQYLLLGHIRRGMDFLEQSLSLSRELHDKHNEAVALGSLGGCYLALGDYNQSIRLLKESLSLTRRFKDKPNEAATLSQLGIVYLEMDDYEKSIGCLEEGLRVMRDISPNNKRGLSRYHDLLTIAYLLTGDHTRALRSFKEAGSPLIRGLFFLLAGSPNDAVKNVGEKFMQGTIEDSWLLNQKDMIVNITLLLGLAYEKLGDKPKARDAYKRAVDTCEKEREELTDDQKVFFMDKRALLVFSRMAPYEGLIRSSPPEEAFSISEAIKARILMEQMARRHIDIDFGVPVSLRKEETDLSASISTLTKQQYEALKKDDARVLGEVLKEIGRKDKDRNALIARLRKAYPEYAAIRYPQPLKLPEIGLRPDEVLIEYAVTDSKTLAWLVKNGKILKTISAEVTKKDLDALIDDYRGQITNPEALKRSMFDPKSGRKLYGLLIKDFLPLMSKQDKIIIVPDKKLGLLPFEALVTGLSINGGPPKSKNDDRPSGIQFLGDDYNISYYQSASALTMVRQLGKGRRTDFSLFVLSDPVFDAEDGRVKKETQTSAAKANSLLMMSVRETTMSSFERLHQTRLLGENLLSLFAGENSKHLTGLQATETNLKKENLKKYRYLVFATHGILDSHVSGIMEPALVLSQIGNKGYDNGFLTLSKVMGLSLNSDNVALTACQTGSGKLVSGEGVVGLARAFQYAGARSVLASLWSVAEGPTIGLVGRFFYYQRTGMDRLRALRMARNDIRRGGYDHPFFWAPFILIGEGG